MIVSCKTCLSGLFALLVIILFSVDGFCQDSFGVENNPRVSIETPPDSLVQKKVVTTHKGQVYIGVILADDGREVLIETDKLGKIYITKSEISSIVDLKDEKDIKHGEFNATGPFTTRYAFTTNALPITKGENYALLNLYGPEVHFAVTDNLNIGIMSTWIASPFVFAAKYSHKTGNEKINLSAGALLGTSGYLASFRGVGGLYFGNITFGDRKNNVTLAAGYAHLKTGIYNNNYLKPGTYVNDGQIYLQYEKSLLPVSKGPMFSIAGIAKVGAKASFVFDSMFGYFSSSRNQQTFKDNFDGTSEIVSSDVATKSFAMFFMPGMRFQSAENKAIQVSLAGMTFKRLEGYTNKNATSIPIPMVSWFFKF
jgi:hypothetical protein